MQNQIILSNRLLVPSHLLSDSDLKKWHYEWEEMVYEFKEDEFGEVVLDRYNNPVKISHSEHRVLKTYRETFSPNRDPYIALPRGNMAKIKYILKSGYKDLRPLNPLGFKLSMSSRVLTDHRWNDQKRCILEFLKRGYGIVEGDTGSGKTLVGIGATCKLGMTTLVMSKRTDGNEHWEKEFRKHTNIEELEKLYGRKLIGPYKNSKKQVYPITIATVQSFLRSNGRKFLIDNKDAFGFLLLDEVHEFGAPEFSKIVQSINSFASMGLTATVERKDNMHLLVMDMVGPVVAKGTAKQMLPTVHFISTGVEAPEWIEQGNFPRHYKWTRILKHLAEAEERTDLIIKYIHKDAEDGRVIACVSERKNILSKIFIRLKNEGYDTEMVTGDTPQKVRTRIYENIESGKCKILCAGKVLNALVNLPSVDCLHFVTPSSSKTTTKQVYGRARRWLEGKRAPIIRDYVDKGGQLDGAYKNRLALCKENKWKVVHVGIERSQLLGMNIWEKR